MNHTSLVKNVVLVGNFNLTYFDKYFFISNKILSENELLPGSFEEIVGVRQVNTPSYSITILSNQAVFTAVYPENSEEKFLSAAMQFITAAPVSSITAMGINLHWMIESSEDRFVSLSKQLLYNENSAIYSKFFSGENCAFGAYMSRDIGDARLKLDIKPAQLTVSRYKELINYTGIHFQFNYHFEIDKTDTQEKVLKNIANYHVYENDCKEILSIY